MKWDSFREKNIDVSNVQRKVIGGFEIFQKTSYIKEINYILNTYLNCYVIFILRSLAVFILDKMVCNERSKTVKKSKLEFFPKFSAYID